MRFREPLLPLFLSFAAGLLTAKAAFFSFFVLAFAFLAFLAFVLLASAIGSKFIPLPTAWLGVFCLGIAAAQWHRAAAPPVLSVPDSVTAILSGCVVDPALVAADRERFTVELAPGARAQVSLYAREGEKFPSLPYGTLVEFQGRVRSPHNYNNPGSFDFAHFLARQKVYWNASGAADTVKILPGRCGNSAMALIFAIRSGALERLDSLYSSDLYANGMMQAILIGATAKLDRIWTADYRTTGTFHALVISGSHVAVLAAVLLFFLRICAVPQGVAVAATIAAAWLYAGVTGWQAPVLRSAAGMTLYGVGRVFYREGRLLNILFGVALIFVAVDPEQLLDASFQLSFLAVAAIGAFVVPALEATSAPLARGLSEIADAGKDIRTPAQAAQFRVELRLLIETFRLAFHFPQWLAQLVVMAAARVCIYLWEVFVTSFFIQIALALPMVWYFHRLAFSGLSANALIVPVLSAVVPLGFLAIAFNSHLLAVICAWLLSVARVAVSLHGRWEPNWRIPSPPVWLGALFVLALVWAALRTQRRWLRAAAWVASVACLAVIVWHPFAPRIDRGRLQLSAIDVGQGDSLLTTFPDGTTMLIDAGGIPAFGRSRKPGIDIGEDVVSNYLWTRSIKHLDVVAMTHAHSDHMGGMASVLRNFQPRELWTGATPESPEWAEVRTAAEQYHVTIRPLRRSPAFSFGGAIVQVLAPAPDYEPGDKPKNNDSLVLRLQMGKTSFLLTGDMEKQVEAELSASGLLQHTDVLKVGHHGSRTSSTAELLDQVHPAFGIISAGFENSYGHPHALTLEALEQRHIEVLRTDQRGLIAVSSDGKHISVE